MQAMKPRYELGESILFFNVGELRQILRILDRELIAYEVDMAAGRVNLFGRIRNV